MDAIEQEIVDISDDDKSCQPVPMALLKVQYVQQGDSVYKVLVPTPFSEDDEPTDLSTVNPIICQVQNMKQYKAENYLVEDPYLGSFCKLSSKFKTVKSVVRLPVAFDPSESSYEIDHSADAPASTPVQPSRPTLNFDQEKTAAKKVRKRTVSEEMNTGSSASESLHSVVQIDDEENMPVSSSKKSLKSPEAAHYKVATSACNRQKTKSPGTDSGNTNGKKVFYLKKKPDGSYEVCEAVNGEKHQSETDVNLNGSLVLKPSKIQRVTGNNSALGITEKTVLSKSVVVNRKSPKILGLPLQSKKTLSRNQLALKPCSSLNMTTVMSGQVHCIATSSANKMPPNASSLNCFAIGTNSPCLQELLVNTPETTVKPNQPAAARTLGHKATPAAVTGNFVAQKVQLKPTIVPGSSVTVPSWENFGNVNAQQESLSNKSETISSSTISGKSFVNVLQQLNARMSSSSVSLTTTASTVPKETHQLTAPSAARFPIKNAILKKSTRVRTASKRAVTVNPTMMANNNVATADSALLSNVSNVLSKITASLGNSSNTLPVACSKTPSTSVAATPASNAPQLSPASSLLVTLNGQTFLLIPEKSVVKNPKTEPDCLNTEKNAVQKSTEKPVLLIPEKNTALKSKNQPALLMPEENAACKSKTEQVFRSKETESLETNQPNENTQNKMSATSQEDLSTSASEITHLMKKTKQLYTRETILDAGSISKNFSFMLKQRDLPVTSDVENKMRESTSTDIISRLSLPFSSHLSNIDTGCVSENVSFPLKQPELPVTSDVEDDISSHDSLPSSSHNIDTGSTSENVSFSLKQRDLPVASDIGEETRDVMSINERLSLPSSSHLSNIEMEPMDVDRAKVKIKLKKKRGGKRRRWRYSRLDEPCDPDYSHLIKPCSVRIQRLDMPVDDRGQTDIREHPSFYRDDKMSSVLKMLQQRQAALKAVRLKSGKA